MRSGQYAYAHRITYDANNNVTFLDDRLSNAYDMTMTFDGLDRINLITDSYSGTGDVNYDTLGNITYYRVGTKAINYVYNSNKQLTSTNGGESYSFAYDSKGNVTNNGRRGFAYNAANQMVNYSGLLYTYDGNNKRVKSVKNGVSSYAYYGSNGKLMFNWKNGVYTDYYFLGGKLAAKKAGSVTTLLHTDYLGSIVAESNTSGTVLSRKHYQPFGENIEPPSDDVGYTGHKFDTDLGLNYMQARYYDPVIGRFYSNDPIGFTGEVDTFNRYSYVANNPYKFTDPNGEAKVYTWDAGKTPTGKSRAGHASILTDDGVYLSMFPTNGNNSKAEFHTFDQDVAIYDGQPDMVFDVDLPNEALASLYANGIKSDESQTWRLDDNNCATVTLQTLNAGGTNLPVHDYNSPVQVDGLLNMGAAASKGMTGIPVVRVTGRLDSKYLDEMKE